MPHKYSPEKLQARRKKWFKIVHGHTPEETKHYKGFEHLAHTQIKQVPKAFLWLTPAIRDTLIQRAKGCVLCGWHESLDALVVHHRDGNRRNNMRRNLIVLCRNCHALVHLGLRKLPKRAKQKTKST